MMAFIGLMIPLTAILMPVLIVGVIFWFKNERHLRETELIKQGLDKGYSVEDMKKMLEEIK